MHVYAYLRCSTDDQDVNHGRLEIEEWVKSRGLNVDEIEWILDSGVSGVRGVEKRRLQEIVDGCQSGDLVVVQELSRLSRSPRDILNLRHIFDKKGVAFHAVKEDLTWSKNGAIGDTNMKTMLYSMFAEMEHDRISERVKTGIRAKRANLPETIERERKRELVYSTWKEHGGRKKDINERVGWDVKSEWAYLKRMGNIPKEKTRVKTGSTLTCKQKEQMRSMFSDGRSWGEVRDALGVTKERIRRALKEVD